MPVHRPQHLVHGTSRLTQHEVPSTQVPALKKYVLGTRCQVLCTNGCFRPVAALTIGAKRPFGHREGETGLNSPMPAQTCPLRSPNREIVLCADGKRLTQPQA